MIYETGLEEQALSRLRVAREQGSRLAMDQAQAILDRAMTDPVAGDLRSRIFALAEALFQSIHMQMSVPRYKAIEIGRGTTLDTLDNVLNNRIWLERQFDAIKKLESEDSRLKEIDAIVNWTNPGPGGFHDDLGDPRGRPHLVTGLPYDKDPATLRGPQTGFDQNPIWRRTWCRHAGSLYDQPVQMRYAGLDRSASYKIRVVYAGDMFQVKVRLTANESIEVHPLLLKPRDMKPLEFDIPRKATATGVLKLSWHAGEGRGNGRGCQVAEVWLIKKEP